MPLVTSKELLLHAKENHYAVGAFNVENMEMVQAVIAAAEELRSPVILQTTPGTLKYAPAELYYANVAAVAKAAKVPVAVHLDHGSSFELALWAFRAGYTSIMIDGSQKTSFFIASGPTESGVIDSLPNPTARKLLQFFGNSAFISSAITEAAETVASLPFL